MFAFDKRVGKFVRVPAKVKPIGNGKNAGCTRSMVQGTDIQRVFNAKIGVSRVFHHWAR